MIKEIIKLLVITYVNKYKNVQLIFVFLLTQHYATKGFLHSYTE